MTNYRPISLIIFFSKLFETTTYSRLSHHLHVNNILATKQHDFRQGISTENAAFSATDNVFTSINQNMYVGGIFSDLAKACNCVNYVTLLAKLYFYGI